MLFNSIEFPIFLLIVLALYFCFALRAQNALLLVASYVFYGFWDWRFLSLILVSTAVDFAVGRYLGRTTDPSVRKLLLAASIAVNLGILGFFKYCNFFGESMAELLELLGFTVHVPTLQILLPVGISFYTFQTMSYTFDVYRRQLEPTRDLLTFALFVAFFPQLVAGPIERARNLLPALSAPRRVGWRDIAVGLELMLIGYFKKVGIADSLGPLVDAAYFDPARTGGSDLLLASFLFSFQIYCDFSGYSDIARGVARLFGVRLMRNFEQPYLSSSITEFWRRWHISLSSWLRDYLYIPLGGNRRGPLRTYFNLMLTMLLGGLWHGASWTFLIWGGIHGLYLAVNKWISRLGVARRGRWSRLVSVVLTFHLVTLTWVFFRAESLSHALQILSGILTLQPAIEVFDGLSWFNPRLLVLLATLLLLDLWQDRRGDHAFMVSWPMLPRSVAYGFLIVVVLVLANLNTNVPFIYFQF